MNPSQPLDRHSDLVGLRLLTRDDAQEIKDQATLVLRSLRRRRYCDCERPIKDEHACAKCGRPFRALGAAAKLAEVIREMDRVLYPPRACGDCGEVMTFIEGSPSFSWCEGCQRARAAA